uniref:Uncharacterized protein n=1 Tax=Glossina brevipalpis TaxID=37001 RepID=A0A1A9W9S2_9MUSC
MSILHKQDLTEISNSTCIPNDFNSKTPTCNIVDCQHLRTIEELSSDIIFLNGFIGTLGVGNDQQMLKGIFLIKFHNVTIRINGKTYVSEEISNYRALPSIIQLTPLEKEREILLSLQMLEKLHMNNTKYYLQTETTIHQYSTWGFFIMVTVINLRILIGVLNNWFREIWLPRCRRLTERSAMTNRHLKNLPLCLEFPFLYLFDLQAHACNDSADE